ncbi:MAG: hypothetical protein R3C10_11345 [Pirellulales bacterium]
MLDACTIAVFEALTVGRVLEIALWVGLAVVSVGLVVLLGTSWGQSKPLQKCTILSLLVHVLLAFYAMTVRFQTAGGTGDDRRSVSVTFVDRGDEVDQVPERAADANPWDDLPTEDTVVEIPEVTSVATPAEENLIEAFDEVLPPPEPLDDIAIAVSAPPLTLAPREPLADVPLPVEAAHATLEAAAATAIDVPALHRLIPQPRRHLPTFRLPKQCRRRRSLSKTWPHVPTLQVKLPLLHCRGKTRPRQQHSTRSRCPPTCPKPLLVWTRRVRRTKRRATSPRWPTHRRRSIWTSCRPPRCRGQRRRDSRGGRRSGSSRHRAGDG